LISCSLDDQHGLLGHFSCHNPFLFHPLGNDLPAQGIFGFSVFLGRSIKLESSLGLSDRDGFDGVGLPEGEKIYLSYALVAIIQLSCIWIVLALKDTPWLISLFSHLFEL
jgi:hypothetical protein